MSFHWDHIKFIEPHFRLASWQRAKPSPGGSITVANVMIQWLSSTKILYHVCVLRWQANRQEGQCVRENLQSWQWLTLPDKGLAGVQQDVTALHYHPLNGQVLPDVLSVTHLVVHYSEHTQAQQLVQCSTTRWIRISSFWQAYLDSSSNLDLANSRLLRSTCSWGVCANNSCRVMM